MRAGLVWGAEGAAVGFYERLGWRKEGEVFEEAGLEHFRMVLPGGAGSAATEGVAWSAGDGEGDDEVDGVLGV